MPEPAQLVWVQAARRGTYESRSALATALSKRWTVDQVSAQKMQESHVMAAYALRVDGVDLGLPRPAWYTEGGAATLSRSPFVSPQP